MRLSKLRSHLTSGMVKPVLRFGLVVDDLDDFDEQDELEDTEWEGEAKE